MSRSDANLLDHKTVIKNRRNYRMKSTPEPELTTPVREPDPGQPPMTDPTPGLEPDPEPNPDPTPDSPDPEPDRDPSHGEPIAPEHHHRIALHRPRRRGHNRRWRTHSGR